MKILAWIGGILTLLLVGVYVMVFTGFGNGILKPIIQEKIIAQTKLDSKLRTFKLSMSEIEILLELNKNNTISIKGTYSLFSQSMNLTYAVNLEKLKTLKPLTQTQLNSSFHTDGTLIGDMAFLKIDGKSDVAQSKTSYKLELTDLNPTSIIAKVDTLNLSALLVMLNQKAYANAEINLDVNFKNIKMHELDGNVVLVTKNGTLNSKVMKNDFNITIPKTAFSMKLDAKLAGDNVDYNYLLSSNLAKLTSSGMLTPEPLALDIKYGVDVKELAVLKPLSGADVRGPLRLDGSVKGTKAKIVVDGRSDIAASNTTFSAVLKNFAPSSAKVDIKHMKLQKVLYMVKQPHFADALFALDVTISNANPKELKGVVKSTITKGLVDSKYMTKAYKFKTQMPRTTFSATTLSTLDKNIIDTKLNFVSNLANFDIKRARFNTKDASLKSDYRVKVHNLNRLYFASERHLKGSIIANGELTKAKDLDFTMHSDVAGGKLDAKLHNDDFIATLNSMQTLDVLEMLIYPKVFKSTIDGDVKYNLAMQKGTFDGKLSNGKFTRNQVLDLTKQYGKIDLYKETFKGDVSAKINKEKIVASLDLKSNKSSIITKNTKLNSKTQRIDSKIEINANRNKFELLVTGDVNAPKVKIDADKLIKDQATKAIKKEVSKYLNRFF